MKARMKVQAAAVALMLGTSLAAHAQLGSLAGLFGKATAGGAVDIDGYLKNAISAELLMRDSLDQMAASLASKEELANIEALKKQAAEKTDSKEKAAIEQDIVKSEAALLNTKDFDKIANEDAKKMDATQKKRLAAASYNFMLAALKDKELMGQSQGVISSLVSSPSNLSKLGAVKDTAFSLKSQLELASSLATKVPKVFAAVGVKNPPTKASDAPVEIAD
jgi:hypothetical protein